MKNIMVIYGGDSSEHDISIITAVESMMVAPIKGYRIIPVYVKNSVWYTGRCLFEIKNYLNFSPARYTKVLLFNKALYEIKRSKKLVKLFDIDCALILAHGGGGENGEWQGLFDTNGIPYTSSNVEASAICMNKSYCKTLLKSWRVNVVEGITINSNPDLDEIENILKEFDLPVVVKPVSQGSSIGISLVNSVDTLKTAINTASKYSSRLLIEKGLNNCLEFNQAAVFLRDELVLSKIEKRMSSGDIFTYNDKYLSNKNSRSATDFLDDFENNELKLEISNITKSVYVKLNLWGIVRFDYLYSNNILYLNEINTIPGSLAHHLFENMTYQQLLKSIIDESIKRIIFKPCHFQSNVLETLNSISK
ncbi:MAG: hypothetical protein LBF68_03555 [Christensenellaceae bacterium]|jgi:D-alanine-D-alanine ligase|nr:hypothetical protein [Christensenellaceae bacterium]